MIGAQIRPHLHELIRQRSSSRHQCLAGGHQRADRLAPETSQPAGPGRHSIVHQRAAQHPQGQGRTVIAPVGRQETRRRPGLPAITIEPGRLSSGL